ncbi:hypothetical protein [Microbacterium sp. CPCC 204701]|uniref:hypothetical protein n=1 Tax=Microbacterium sp. CPCC 204701 TaxID=2493084 RepID=UPI000FD797FB|nr:hypothetical protein [Microbacterium sp. CPCC 204701]
MSGTPSDDPADRLAQEAEEVRLQIARAQARLYNREKQHREARRQYQRDYYAQHREELLEYQRQYRAAQRERDPDAYREGKRARTKRWRDKHRDEVNARLREKYRADAEERRQRRREAYARNPEEQRSRRRAYYAANKEKQLAAQQRWRDREKRRVEAGLPVRRLHRVDDDERFANSAAADAFFGREWTDAELKAALGSIETPPELLAAWKRDCLRARAAHHLSVQKYELGRLEKELARVRPGPKPKPPMTPEEIEEARLDAIGRQINERLRHREPPRRTHHLDPAAPHPQLLRQDQMGMNR